MPATGYQIIRATTLRTELGPYMHPENSGEMMTCPAKLMGWTAPRFDNGLCGPRWYGRPSIAEARRSDNERCDNGHRLSEERLRYS